VWADEDGDVRGIAATWAEAPAEVLDDPEGHTGRTMSKGSS
jgi:hypothetical protein